VHVKLAPTAPFVVSAKEVSAVVGDSFRVRIIQAPVLPDGSAGPPESVRYGFTSSLGLSSSDAVGLVVDSNLFASGGGIFEGSVKAVNSGDYTVTPTSSMFRPAPGQTVTVHVRKAGAPSVFTSAKYYVVKDTVGSFHLSGAGGDSLVFTSEDPT